MKYTLIISLLFCTFGLKAQCTLQIDTMNFNYYNRFTSSLQLLTNYSITNNTNEDYITWVGKEAKSNNSDVDLIKSYFFTHRDGEDFSLANMMYEYGSTLVMNVNIIGIGSSFLKVIRPNETFIYLIGKDNIVSRFYESRIVVVKKKEVEKCLGISIPKDFLFTQQSIFLIGK